MSKTRKSEPYNIFAKEKKAYRKTWYKRFRRRSKMAVDTGQEPENFKRTSGWLTW